MSGSALCALDCGPFFFFNDTATTEIYTLSLHDALPICWRSHCWRYQATCSMRGHAAACTRKACTSRCCGLVSASAWARSEEHTSELQSQSNLVCRLLLEKKTLRRISQRHRREASSYDEQ